MKTSLKKFFFILFLVVLPVLSRAGELDASNKRLKSLINWNSGLPTGRGVKVAVIDTGIKKDFPGTVLPGRNCLSDNDDVKDLDGHGTGSASVIHAIAHEVEILPMKVTDFGWATRADLIECILHSIESGVSIVNISMTFDPSVMDRVKDALGEEKFHETLFVLAGGNNRQYWEKELGDNIIVVGVTPLDPPLAMTSYSARGPGVSLWAPAGEDKDGITVHSIFEQDLYRLYNGTSAAAPVVAGAAAILKTNHPHLKGKELKELILERTSSFGGRLQKQQFLNLEEF